MHIPCPDWFSFFGGTLQQPELLMKFLTVLGASVKKTSNKSTNFGDIVAALQKEDQTLRAVGAELSAPNRGLQIAAFSIRFV